ncbi:hypothetical protein B0H13DRAFT_1919500 [Mycena leptocephala]|nr:hypothetical protein B0H13DRAFT_1919500 [Mycena leptocephala]
MHSFNVASFTAQDFVKCENWQAQFKAYINDRGLFPGPTPPGYREVFIKKQPGVLLPEDFAELLVTRARQAEELLKAAKGNAPHAVSDVSMSAGALATWMQGQQAMLHDAISFAVVESRRNSARPVYHNHGNHRGPVGCSTWRGRGGRGRGEPGCSRPLAERIYHQQLKTAKNAENQKAAKRWINKKRKDEKGGEILLGNANGVVNGAIDLTAHDQMEEAQPEVQAVAEADAAVCQAEEIEYIDNLVDNLTFEDNGMNMAG